MNGPPRCDTCMGRVPVEQNARVTKGLDDLSWCVQSQGVRRWLMSRDDVVTFHLRAARAMVLAGQPLPRWLGTR